MPRRLRPAILAIYRFARTADDIADEGSASASERLRRLGALRAGLEELARERTPDHPVVAGLAPILRTHALPLAPFHALLDAFEQDVLTTRYASYEQLLAYCAKSANPVGRLLLALYGTRSSEDASHADAVCSALQLINFWQDVAVDWRKGRVYVPQEDLRRFGVDERQIAEQRADAGWRALMRFEVDRARALLESGRPLCGALGGRIGLELRLVIAGGSRILDKITAAGGDVFRSRPVLGRGDWMTILARAALPSKR